MAFAVIKLPPAFYIFQADATLVHALDYMFDICKKAGGGRKDQKPWAVRVDVDNREEDPCHEKVHCAQAAPVLFLYFNAGYVFDGAIICADKHKIKIDSCVSNSILCYISVFHVFQVGFNENVFNFLAVLEHLLLGAPYKPGTYVPIKMEKFVSVMQARNNTKSVEDTV